MLYMIIERFPKGPGPVYERFRERGRLMPEGVEYVSSWVTEDLSTCYQVMKAEKRESLDQWINEWKDIADFEVIPVMTSQEAAAAFASTNK